MPKVLRRAYASAPLVARWDDGNVAWDEKLAEASSWLHGGEEVLVASRFEPLRRAGLNAGAQRARPELQRRKQRESRALYLVPAWKVGLYLAFQRFRRDGSPGPWWTGGNSWVLAKLTSVTPGPRRVRAAAAVAALLGVLDRDHPDPCEALRPLLRTVAWSDEDLAGG